MWKLGGTVCLLILGTASAIKLIGDYEEYSDLKRGEETLGHWRDLHSDHTGEGQGEGYHHDYIYDKSGELEHDDSKAGGHVKHHVTKGYKDFHHKDEVGQTTSYIDSSGDTGDHHGRHFLRSKWGGHEQAGAHGDRHKSASKGEAGSIEKKVFKEKKEDSKDKIGEFLYVKRPISIDKKFYSHVPLQYVPYPHYYY